MHVPCILTEAQPVLLVKGPIRVGTLAENNVPSWQTTCPTKHLRNLVSADLPGGYSYEQAAGVMRQMSISQDEIKPFYRRMVLNVLTKNQDDHTKNTSYLMDRNGYWLVSGI